ncbi:MAG: hypothetical protein AB7J40_04830 [Candidatus Altimarinota bacterium]
MKNTLSSFLSLVVLAHMITPSFAQTDTFQGAVIPSDFTAGLQQECPEAKSSCINKVVREVLKELRKTLKGKDLRQSAMSIRKEALLFKKSRK